MPEQRKPEPKAVDCPECARLMAEHKRLKRIYATAVDHLFTTGYQVADVEYKELKNSIEEARVQSEIARRELDKHRLFLHSKAG
jgi:hypothetical protein